MDKCEVCGAWVKRAECGACEEAREALGNAARPVMEWVQAVAKKAAEDAVEASRSRLVGEE